MFELPLVVLVLLEQVTVVELVHDGPELRLGVAAEIAEITHAERIQLAVAGLDDGDSFLAGHHAVADVAGSIVGGGGVAELGVFQPGMHQVRAGVDLVEVLGVVDRFINSFYYFLNKLPFQHLGKKIAPFLKNSLFQLFLTMAHLFVSAFGSLFIFYLILTLILRLGKLFCRNYIIFSRF